MSSAASSAGWRTESSLAQASVEAGNPGVVMTPVRRQRARSVLGVPGQRAQIGRRAEAGHTRHPFVPGGQVQGQHAAEAEADDEAGRRLGDLGLGQKRQVVQPAQRREVTRRLAGAAQRRGDHAPARLTGQPVGQGGIGEGDVGRRRPWAAAGRGRAATWPRTGAPGVVELAYDTGRPPARAGAGMAPASQIPMRCASSSRW